MGINHTQIAPRLGVPSSAPSRRWSPIMSSTFHHCGVLFPHRLCDVVHRNTRDSHNFFLNEIVASCMDEGIKRHQLAFLIRCTKRQWHHFTIGSGVLQWQNTSIDLFHFYIGSHITIKIIHAHWKQKSKFYLYQKRKNLRQGTPPKSIFQNTGSSH